MEVTQSEKLAKQNPQKLQEEAEKLSMAIFKVPMSVSNFIVNLTNLLLVIYGKYNHGHFEDCF